MHKQGLFLGLIVAFALANPGFSQEVRTVDPSGQWQGQHGALSLMLAGDTLSFCYSAVFGATAHLCDGVGVAGLVAAGEYHYVDEQGTVAFIVTAKGVRLKPVSGVPSFCGANWPGDDFTRQGYQPPQRGTVAVAKTHFHVVGRTPSPRRGYVVRGDTVEVVVACFDGGDDWVLARFRGAVRTTAGLLRKNDLEISD